MPTNVHVVTAPTTSIRTASATDTGLQRDLNEDNHAVLARNCPDGDDAALLIVADGMGGHQAGELASLLAVNTIADNLAWLINPPDHDYEPLAQMLSPEFERFAAQYRSKTTLPFIEKHLHMAVAQANQRVYSQSVATPEETGNLGTTLSCAIIIGNRVLIANVGDSRTYRIRNGEAELLTDDHSYVGVLVRMGQLQPDAYFTHPQRNFVTRSLGHQHDVEIDIGLFELESGDRLLVCTDGLWETLHDSAEWLPIVSNHNLHTACRQLISHANGYGGKDNITVALAEFTAQ